MNKINFLISLLWAKEGRDVGDTMLKIEKCRQGVRASPTPEKLENLFRLLEIPCILARSVFAKIGFSEYFYKI